MRKWEWNNWWVLDMFVIRDDLKHSEITTVMSFNNWMSVWDILQLITNNRTNSGANCINISNSALESVLEKLARQWVVERSIKASDNEANILSNEASKTNTAINDTTSSSTKTSLSTLDLSDNAAVMQALFGKSTISFDNNEGSLWLVQDMFSSDTTLEKLLELDKPVTLWRLRDNKLWPHKDKSKSNKSSISKVE